jgi:hypothetical protein
MPVTFTSGVIGGLIFIFMVALAALIMGSWGFTKSTNNEKNLKATISELEALKQMVFSVWGPTNNGSFGLSGNSIKKAQNLSSSSSSFSSNSSTNSVTGPFKVEPVMVASSSATTSMSPFVEEPYINLDSLSTITNGHDLCMFEEKKQNEENQFLVQSTMESTDQKMESVPSLLSQPDDVPLNQIAINLTKNPDQVIVMEQVQPEQQETKTITVPIQNLNLEFFETSDKNVGVWAQVKKPEEKEPELFSLQKPMGPLVCQEMHMLPETWAKSCVSVPLVCKEAGMYEFSCKGFVENKHDTEVTTSFFLLQRSQSASNIEFANQIISSQRDVVTNPHSLSEQLLTPGVYYCETKEIVFMCYSTNQKTFLPPANMIVSIIKVAS